MVAEALPGTAVAAIINFDASTRTLRTVESLITTSGASWLRVVVIDNGSSPPECERLRTELRSAKLLSLPENRGYAAAANAAAAYAGRMRATYLWLLNNDLVFEENAADKLRNTLERDQAAAAAAPVTVSYADPHTILSAGVDVNLWLGSVSHRFVHRPLSDLPTHAYPVDALEGSAILFRLSALQRVGPLDESFFMYWEDTEWSIRARRAGYQLLVVPTARVLHEEGASSAPLDRIVAIQGNRIRFVQLCASFPQRVVFYAYFLAWLPAYVATRLVPRFGGRPAMRALSRVMSAIWRA